MAIEFTLFSRESNSEPLRGTLARYRQEREALLHEHASSVVFSQLQEFQPTHAEDKKLLAKLTEDQVEVDHDGDVFLLGKEKEGQARLRQRLNIRITVTGAFEAQQTRGAWYALDTQSRFQDALHRGLQVEHIKNAFPAREAMAKLQKSFFKKQQTLAKRYVKHHFLSVYHDDKTKKQAWKYIEKHVQVDDTGAIYAAQGQLQSDYATDKAIQKLIRQYERQDAVISLKKKEMMTENIIYGTAAFAGVLVSAGANYWLKEPQALGMLATMPMAISMYLHSKFGEEERAHERQTRQNRLAKLGKRLTGAAFWFLSGMVGETMAESAVGISPVSTIMNHIGPGHVGAESGVIFHSVQAQEPMAPQISQPVVPVQPEIVIVPPETAQMPSVDLSSYQGEWHQLMQNATDMLGNSFGWINPENNKNQAEVIADFQAKFGSQLAPDVLQSMLDRIAQASSLVEYRNVRLDLAQELRALGVR
jgi:hypothetical protein